MAMVDPGLFVGRERELERLGSALGEARDGDGRVVALVGEPGIGKTRLAQEFEEVAAREGARVLWGRSHEAGGAPPYWPWIEVLRACLADVDEDALAERLGDSAAQLASLLPELSGSVPQAAAPAGYVEAEHARWLLFEGVARFLSRTSAARPLVIVLDDLHWSDKATLQLLQHLAAQLRGMRILLLATYRDVEVTRTHPLREALRALTREAQFERLQLDRLRPTHVRDYLESLVKSPTDRLVTVVAARTGGNPFFLREVGHLVERDPEAVLAGALPEGIRDAIGGRLDALTPGCQELLRTAALVGPDFSFDELHALSEHDEDALIALIEEALEHGIVDELARTGRYSFSHALIQETLLEELSATRRASLHGRIAETLEASPSASAEAARLARHYLGSAALRHEHAAKAAHYSRLAGEQAEAVFAFDESAGHYENYLAHVESTLDVDADERAAVLTALARCHRASARMRDAWRCCMQAIDIYSQADDAIGLAVATLEAMQIWAPTERLEGLRAAALEALGEGAPGLRSQLLLGWFPGAASPSREKIEEARALGEQEPRREFEAELLRAQADLAYGEGRLQEAHDAFLAAHRAWTVVRDGSDAAACIQSAQQVALVSGSLDQAHRDGERALRYSREVHARMWEQFCSSQLAAVALLRADHDLFDEIASSIPRENGNVEFLLAARAELAGDLEQAFELAPSPDAAYGIPQFMAPSVHGARARIAHGLGDRDRTRLELDAFADTLRHVVHLRGKGTAIAEAGEALIASDDASLMRPAYAALEGWPSARLSPWVGRGWDWVRGSLAVRLGLIDEAEQHFRTGVTWAERERCPVEAGRNMQGFAEVAVQRGDVAVARDWLERAAGLFEQHGAKLYLGQVEASRVALPGAAEVRSRYPDGLSPREVEVLALIAGGMSNRQIAEQLVIAPNTVATHVKSIFNKIGASNRAEAAVYAERNGLTS